MLIPIDFEFHSSNEPKPHLVCAAVGTQGYDLEDSAETAFFLEYMESIKGETLVAYYAVAEARCLYALGINPMDYKWVDLYAEWRMMQNSKDEFAYGNYVDKGGCIKYAKKVFNPTTEEDEEEVQTVPANLVNFTYKTTGEVIDSVEKNQVRDIILSKDSGRIRESKERIIAYCVSDTKYLLDGFATVVKFYESQGFLGFQEHILERGEYSAATAICEANGLPIDMDLLDKIICNTETIIEDSRDKVNAEFAQHGLTLFHKAFQRPSVTLKNGKVREYKPTPAKKETSAYQSLIEKLALSDFPKTDKGAYKSDKDTLETFGYVPVLETLRQHGKLESSLKWFKENNKSGFFEALGSDNRVRPFYGVFGTQTGRNAAKAKTFPLAMSSWLRAIVRPTEGNVIVGADFSQQEVYVAAVLSGDMKLLNAYNSGDVYTAFGKEAGLIPPEGNKHTHKLERQMCKGTILGSTEK